jgi:hypothetical protein
MREKLSITKSRVQEKNKLLVTGSNRHVLRQRDDARSAMPVAAQGLPSRYVGKTGLMMRG